jgi:protein-S-isoprenylcysteine O-methyltransferase Ste14
MFRLIFVVVVVGAVGMSAYFRRRARRIETIPRAREGRTTFAARMLFAAPLFLSLVAYMVNPNWMAWSSFGLPDAVRWIAAAVALSMLPALYWVLTTIGENISETTLTKSSHVLVVRGPYRWIRHPLYTASTIAFVALGVVAANWFIIAIAVLAGLLITTLVIPREEAHLTARFGEAYRHYTTTTGAVMPRLRR